VPVYEYLCESCGKIHEVMQKMKEPPPSKCGECGSRKLAKLVSHSAFQLKGGGWYSDLYASPKKKEAKEVAGESPSGAAAKEAAGGSPPGGVAAPASGSAAAPASGSAAAPAPASSPASASPPAETAPAKKKTGKASGA
jgi:putative FmdB family regulatory protein